MSNLDEALRKIEKQQPKEHTTVWGVGEQLKDILRAEPELAELVNRDLDVKGMGLADCERKIKARADEIHKAAGRSGVCVTPMEAEGIIRKFYGLPERGTEPNSQSSADSSPERVAKSGAVIDLADFF